MQINSYRHTSERVGSLRWITGGEPISPGDEKRPFLAEMEGKQNQ